MALVKGVPRTVADVAPRPGLTVGSWELQGVEARLDDEGDTYSVTMLLFHPVQLPPDDPTSDVTGGIFNGSVEMRVGLDSARRVFSAQLLNPDGFSLDASNLGRFAWARWLTVADAAVRELQDPGSHPLADFFSPGTDMPKLVKAQRRKQRQRVAKPNRPGRAGHDDAFYRERAERYRELRLAGSIRPTKDLAEEYAVSRNTAAGWINNARGRGLLAAARRGRPG